MTSYFNHVYGSWASATENRKQEKKTFAIGKLKKMEKCKNERKGMERATSERKNVQYTTRRRKKISQISQTERRHDCNQVTLLNAFRSCLGIYQGTTSTISISSFIWSGSFLHSVFVSRVLWGLDWTHLCALPAYAGSVSVQSSWVNWREGGRDLERLVDLDHSQEQSWFYSG